MFPILTSSQDLRARGTAIARSCAAIVGGLLFAPALTAGTWTKVTANAPSQINLMLLLSDGTVMCAKNDFSTISKSWYRLTPNAQGSYVGGTWTTLANSIDTRLYQASQVMRDGRVFLAGGEYGTGYSKAEVYNPLTNTWTGITPPAALWNTATDGFSDCMSEMLPDGQVLIMPNAPHTFGVGLRYNPVTNTWTNAGALKNGQGNQVEASWVKLPDQSILTVDFQSTTTQRYLHATNSWVVDALAPTALYDFTGEIGAAVLLPTGKAFFIGATGHTAIYTPSGTNFPGTWVVGPDIPAAKGQPDAPAAMLVNGNVLCAVSPQSTAAQWFPPPTTFYEYDPVANTWLAAPSPIGTQVNQPVYQSAFLALPDGKVLYSHGGTDLYVYTPTGGPIAAGKPTISSISINADGSYHLVGTGLNGISEGAYYGDDAQMNSNYPIVRLKSGANVYYARTYDWSSTGVMTGATPVSTEFKLPASLPAGTYQLEVVANGFASDPVTFATPICQANLGFGGPGPAVLSICGGNLSSGTTADLWVSQAKANQPGLLVASLTQTPTNFLGGTLIPLPLTIQISIGTNALGQVHIPGVPGGSGPLSLYMQYIYTDSALIHGVGLTNAVRMDILP